MQKTFSSFLLVTCLLFSAASDFTTIAIVATNDIHGSALPTTMMRSDSGVKYNYGGLATMGGIIDIIKAEYPNNTIFVDAGDQFQGGIESSKLISSGKIMNDFYSVMGLASSAVGNHEWDFGPSFLLPYMSSKEGVNLAANIRSELGEEIFLPKQQLSQIVELSSGIRIGLIGLTTIFTKETTSAFADKKFPDYKFLEYKSIVIAESSKLRRNGANAVLVLGHLGNNCYSDYKYGKWDKDTPQDTCDSDQASNLIESLPDGTIDGVLQGHRHKFAHHFKNGIPFLGTINGGYYFNILYLRFQDKKVVGRTIEGPIPVCEKIFANLGKCDYLSKDELQVAGDLVNWKFHNKAVQPNTKLQAIFEQQWLPKMKPYLEDLAQNEIYLTPDPNIECELANLINNLMQSSVSGIDIAILNPGSMRTEWLPGIVQYQHFYNMFPFQNQIISFDITGSELLQVLEIVQAGPLGFYPVWGLQQTLTLNGKRGIVNATLINGTPIEPAKTYRGIATDFILKGGDDFKKVIGTVYIPRNQKTEGDIKVLLKVQLQRLAIIKQGSLIHSKNPRFVFV